MFIHLSTWGYKIKSLTLTACLLAEATHSAVTNIGKGIKYTRANVKWKWSPGYTKCAAILTHQKKYPPFFMWHRRHFLQIVMGKTDVPYFAEQPNLLKLYFHQEYLSHLCQSCLIPTEGVQIGWQMKVQLYVLFCFLINWAMKKKLIKGKTASPSTSRDVRLPEDLVTSFKPPEQWSQAMVALF